MANKLQQIRISLSQRLKNGEHHDETILADLDELWSLTQSRKPSPPYFEILKPLFDLTLEHKLAGAQLSLAKILVGLLKGMVSPLATNSMSPVFTTTEILPRSPPDVAPLVHGPNNTSSASPAGPRHSILAHSGQINPNLTSNHEYNLGNKPPRTQSVSSAPISGGLKRGRAIYEDNLPDCMEIFRWRSQENFQRWPGSYESWLLLLDFAAVGIYIIDSLKHDLILYLVHIPNRHEHTGIHSTAAREAQAAGISTHSLSDALSKRHSRVYPVEYLEKYLESASCFQKSIDGTIWCHSAHGIDNTSKQAHEAVHGISVPWTLEESQMAFQALIRPPRDYKVFESSPEKEVYRLWWTMACFAAAGVYTFGELRKEFELYFDENVVVRDAMREHLHIVILESLESGETRVQALRPRLEASNQGMYFPPHLLEQVFERWGCLVRGYNMVYYHDAGACVLNK
ncbi:hypothetical protein GQ44DRAFT_770467 [Phaeosphaeriaceae sp. PMI808]|nr:hypothetical protein GQ44DRAFT_770467 [Phaeosphaeriaceae sp. PMI808]